MHRISSQIFAGAQCNVVRVHVHTYCTHKTYESTFESTKVLKVPSYTKRWEKGRHVAHLYGPNRKEYLALIEEFMRPSRMSCGLEFYLGEFSDVVFT